MNMDKKDLIDQALNKILAHADALELIGPDVGIETINQFGMLISIDACAIKDIISEEPID